MLLGSCSSGDVFDPFGSGTALIACEQLGRRCRAIEIDPATSPSPFSGGLTRPAERLSCYHDRPEAQGETRAQDKADA